MPDCNHSLYLRSYPVYLQRPGNLSSTSSCMPRSTHHMQLANNELAKELFAAGFFMPEMAPAALTALELMSFDGKDRIVKIIKVSGEMEQTGTRHKV